MRHPGATASAIARRRARLSVQKPVTGFRRGVFFVRQNFVVGSIEITEDSKVEAVRSQLAADCEADEQDSADKGFESLGQHLKVAISQDGAEGEESGVSLKSKRAKMDDDHDDFMAVWGLSGSGVLGGSVNTKAAASASPDEQNPEPAQPRPKRAKHAARSSRASAPGLPGLMENLPGNDAASQGESGADFGQSASWMFGGKSRGALGKAAGKGSKDLDQTEKVLTQHDVLKKQLGDDDIFLSLTFQKISLHAEKLQARNTDDLQKLYRELCTGPAEARASDVMRRIHAAMVEVTAMCQFISAFKDQEATADTMEEVMAEARDMSLPIPDSAPKLCQARRLLELSSAGRWADFFTHLQSDKCTSMFGENTEALIEFQFCCFRTALTKILNQELEAPGLQARDEGVWR